METKIKKLKRAHIATYFDIGILVETPMGVMQVSELTSRRYAVWCCDHTKAETKVNAKILTKEGISGRGFFLSQIKPLLIPMSSLTRSDLEAAGFSCHIDYLSHELQNYLSSGGDFEEYIKEIPLSHYRWLVKNMYDVHNLIPNKLALDLNAFL